MTFLLHQLMEQNKTKKAVAVEGTLMTDFRSLPLLGTGTLIKRKKTLMVVIHSHAVSVDSLSINFSVNHLHFSASYLSEHALCDTAGDAQQPTKN